MKHKYIVLNVIIFIIIIIFCLFVINNKNQNTKVEMFTDKYPPYPTSIIGLNRYSSTNANMRLFNTDGTLSWAASRAAAQALGGDLPTLAQLKVQLNSDSDSFNKSFTAAENDYINTHEHHERHTQDQLAAEIAIDNSPDISYNFGEIWYPYLDLPDNGWVSFARNVWGGRPSGTPHYPTYGIPAWGTTNVQRNWRKYLYVYFTPPAAQHVRPSDAVMNFDYLTNPNYDQKILEKYYLNDDTRMPIYNYRIVHHPFQYTYYTQSLPHYVFGK